MKNKEERLYIREALRLVELTREDNNYSQGRYNNIIDALKRADTVVKNLELTAVGKQSELLIAELVKAKAITEHLTPQERNEYFDLAISNLLLPTNAVKVRKSKKGVPNKLKT